MRVKLHVVGESRSLVKAEKFSTSKKNHPWITNYNPQIPQEGDRANIHLSPRRVALYLEFQNKPKNFKINLKKVNLRNIKPKSNKL